MTDPRQAYKVVHSLSDIVFIVFFAHLAKCEKWDDIHYFAMRCETLLKHFIPLENGVPSKDTIRRVMGMIHPSILSTIQSLWNEELQKGKPELAEKLIAIDGKTMRGNQTKETTPLHLVSAYSVEEGLCFGQTAVTKKSNEITAILKLLKTLKLSGHTVTIDAMVTQVEIAKQIRRQRGHYVLAVKGNQRALYEEIRTYLDDRSFEKQLKKQKVNYAKTVEAARSQVETREYYQTDKINWMEEKGRRTGLKTIGKVVTTIEKAGKVTKESRYYISSREVEIELFRKAVRGHWGIESMHWHLDVTFKEDGNHTLNKTAAQNLNSIRKMALPVLKELPLEEKYQRASLRSRRFLISLDVAFYMEMIYEQYRVQGFLQKGGASKE